ncbi:MAG: DUF465 domain-containing protein [Gammaproteobacteria bacterium]|nr:DUF465 domain-containing protein [Gammaproteobacteria bacterium]
MAKLSDEEKELLEAELLELRLEHLDLETALEHIPITPLTQMQIARIKKRKLKIKDKIEKLEDKLIPDILA